jgi:hypothetical protein
VRPSTAFAGRPVVGQAAAPQVVDERADRCGQRTGHLAEGVDDLAEQAGRAGDVLAERASLLRGEAG